jgi:hypothetical protein
VPVELDSDAVNITALRKWRQYARGHMIDASWKALTPVAPQAAALILPPKADPPVRAHNL